MGSRWLLIACLMLLLQLSYEATSTQSEGGKTAKRPTQRRQPGFFGLLRQFVRDTISDTNYAVRNITDIITKEFPSRDSIKDGTNTTSTSGSQLLTLPEVNAILGRNYRGLVRLFNREFRIALTDSRKNVVRYKAEFRDAVRPYFTAGGFTSTTTPRSTS